jgi:hypothetical protein
MKTSGKKRPLSARIIQLEEQRGRIVLTHMKADEYCLEIWRDGDKPTLQFVLISRDEASSIVSGFDELLRDES